MIDFFASITIALIVVMTIVLFLSNLRQAQILKQMRFVIEDWYQAQMRDRRETFKKQIKMPEVFQWLGQQVNLTIVEQNRKLENPPALEFLTKEGVRLVVSPLPKHKLRSAIRKIEGKRRKVAKLVEPLLGSQPRNAQVVERSNKTVHEWYEVEIETALEKLGVTWMCVDTLFFYMIPIQPVRAHEPLISLELENVKALVSGIITWFKQQFAKVSG